MRWSMRLPRALSEGGHKVSLIGINDDLRELLDKLDDKRPDLVFNLCERFADNDDYEMHVTAVLAMLGQPFTGNRPGRDGIEAGQGRDQETLEVSRSTLSQLCHL